MRLHTDGLRTNERVSALAPEQKKKLKSQVNAMKAKESRRVSTINGTKIKFKDIVVL